MKILVSLFVIIINLSLFGQGKIISSSEANSLFGPVQFSFTVSTNQLFDYLTKTDGTIMLAIEGGNLYISNNMKKTLYSTTSSSVKDGMIYHVFATEVFRDFLETSNASSISIEMREDEILSLTGGGYTLEYSYLCPPYCPD